MEGNGSADDSAKQEFLSVVRVKRNVRLREVESSG